MAHGWILARQDLSTSRVIQGQGAQLFVEGYADISIGGHVTLRHIKALI